MTGVLVEELLADAQAESVRPLRRAIAGIAVREGVEREIISDVALCVEEALANVVRHAYPGRTGPVEVRVLRAPGELEVVVRDMGEGLDLHRADRLGIDLNFIAQLSRHASITSAPGGGAEVRMSFPVRRSARRAAALSTPAA